MKIDKIFIINLEHRTDRKEQMINELNKVLDRLELLIFIIKSAL